MKTTRSIQPSRITPAAATHPTQSHAATIVDSRDLLQHGTTLLIDHAGQRYILRVTRENKLILTK